MPALAGLFSAALVISNVLAAKMLQIGPFVFDGGALLFPLSYIFGDVLTEVYGFRAARKVIWTGFASLLIMALAIAAVGALPAHRQWAFQDDFDNILRQVPRISFASMAGYFAGEWSNSVVLSRMKVATRGRFFPLRAIASTLVGELCDTAIFVAIAFYGAYPLSALLSMAGSNYLFKCAVEAAFLPLTCRAVSFVKKRESADAYDFSVSYSPLPRWRKKA